MPRDPIRSVMILTGLNPVQSKYAGIGHADIGKFEWLVNQHRDTYASIIGHPTLLSYISVAENVSLGRKRFELLEKMLQPCGRPPPRQD